MGRGSTEFVFNQFHGPLLANAQYDFSIDLRPIVPESTSVVVQLLETTTQTVLAEKLWSPPWIPELRQFDLPADQWTTLRLSFNTADHPASAGQPLVIQVRGAYLAIDNVTFLRESLIPASGQYFVSSSEGNDANNGLSPATAWCSYTARVSSFSLQSFQTSIPKKQIISSKQKETGRICPP